MNIVVTYYEFYNLFVSHVYKHRHHRDHPTRNWPLKIPTALEQGLTPVTYLPDETKIQNGISARAEVV
jgi:hypothetical protein